MQAAEAPQAQTTNLSGTVTDVTGAVIPGAEVTVYTGAAVVTHTRTDAQGRFRFQGIPREYTVDVVEPGFRPIHKVAIPFTGDSLTRFTMNGGYSSGPVVDTREPVPLQSTRRPASNGLLVESPARQEANTMPWEYGALFQGGFGLTEDRNSFKFFSAGAHLGKVLTPELGTGPLRGNFEYAVEFFPYWQSFTPKFQRINCPASTGPQGVNPNTCSAPYTVGGTFSGVSVTPIILRWNFTHGQRWMPWIQGAGGVVWTNHKYPAYGNTNPQDVNETGPGSDTSVWNFTPQFGIGTHYFLKPKRSLDFSANAVHISSASLGDRNPGVNASVQLSVGYSWWK